MEEAMSASQLLCAPSRPMRLGLLILHDRALNLADPRCRYG